MTRQEFIDDVRDKLGTLSSLLEELQQFDVSEIEEEDDDTLLQLEDELEKLNEEINETKYRSPEFYQLQEKIDAKQEEIDNHEGVPTDNSDIEDILEEISSMASDAYDKQYTAWDNLGDL